VIRRNGVLSMIGKP